ncbi:hypothetical protein BGZ52_003347 [Haplosporangium bisporale]|nr:hypothetical protein BGZ52_003347 [Haplosporangium bisporale]KAF9202722.1 hypothetical protein BGZ59_002031 [Podila verticillata]KFH66276.1 hypothetical protein MVEG_08375 [Podila verticillata NRRL 6337]
MPVANYQQYQYLHGVNDSTDFIVSELIDHHSTDHSKPKVLIAGAGLGGLTLAILLKKAGIPFEIFERQQELKPLGAGMTLGAGIGPLFQQLGIYDEFVSIAKQATEMSMFQENLKLESIMQVGWLERLVHYREYVLARPDLHSLLLRHVPKENIHLNKKIVSFDQDDYCVLVRFADGTFHRGDILVGADGAYSSVRQHLFKILKASGKLPASDDVPLPFNSVCLVGNTEVLDPQEFPALKSELSEVNTILGVESRCSWTTMTTKQNTVCWSVIHFLNNETSRADNSFRNSDWGPEAAEAMCKQVRNFRVPNGKDGRASTLGEFIDRTPKHLIGKVMLEEKVFETWHGGRVALIGDACHKMNPSGGSGALTAMHDAVTLANWINTIETPSMYYLKKIFKEYRAERYPIVKQAFETSQMFSRNIGKGKSSAVVRTMIKRLPPWLWRRLIIRMFTAQPQAAFLPLIVNKSAIKAAHQPSLHKSKEVLRQQEIERNTFKPLSVAVPAR